MRADFEALITLAFTGFLIVVFILIVTAVLSDDDNADLERAETRYSECIARENSEAFCIEYSLDN